MTETVRFRLSLLSIFGSLVAAVAFIIVFAFSTFATRADVDDKTKDLTGHLSEMRQDIKDVRVEMNKKLDLLISKHTK